MTTLKERADKLEAEGVFLGGPTEFFELAGRKLLITMLSRGLTPNAKVLDIGCGCLRGGYWLIHFLDRGCYFGIEPNKDMLQAGVRLLLEPELIELKSPRFDHNADFNFEVFEQTFDFYVARSIWSHASKNQISSMLDGFVETASPAGVFLTSYIPATWLRKDYAGESWVGRSHESDVAGIVRHRFRWIEAECSTRGLHVEEVRGREYNFGSQRWLKIKRA